MANVKITELTAATALAGTDVLPIVDVGADATKKVSVSDLMRNLPDGTASAPALAFADDQNSGILSPAENELAFATSGTQRLVIDSSGNVGVNNSSPSSYNASADNLVVGATGDTGVTVASGSSSQGSLFFADGTSGSAAAEGYLIYVHSSNYMALGTANTERLRIDSSGNVGIGTTNPDEKLHIAASANSAIRLGQAGGNYAYRLRANVTSSVNGGFLIEDAVSGNDLYQVISGASGRHEFTVNNSEAMRIDSSGNVGIGTSTVSNTLDVRSTSANIGVRSTTSGQNQYIFFSNTADSTNGIITHTGSELRFQQQDNVSGSQITFYTKDSERFRIDSSGNVGIGTTSPQSELTVRGSTPQITLEPTADTQNCRLQFATTNGTVQSFLGGGGSEGAALKFLQSTSERARIDSSGRLLIGTSSASIVAALTPQVFIEGTSANASALGIKANTNDTLGSFLALAKSRGTANGNNTIVQSGDTLGEIRFAGADGTDTSSEGARIAAVVDGTPGANDLPTRLSFQTTADGASFPTERVRLDSTGVIRHLAAADVNGGSGYVVLHTASAGTTRHLIQGVHSATTVLNGTVSFIVFTNGNVQNTNNSYGAISDIKLKENIVDASSQWSDIKNLRVRNYNFIEGQTHTQIGVVAQEVETVSPGLVSESPDTDDEGNDLGTVTKSVNYSVLYMKAVKALQEAMDRIETLETKVAALEAQ